MTFISYSQNFEDVMLMRALKNIQNGFYIDVGAAWSDEHSVTKAFYDRGWRGINIEPNPAFKDQYIKERCEDINLFLAVGDREDKKDMFFVSGTGLSSLNKDFADQYQRDGRSIEKCEVEISTLAKICDKYVHGSEIHFLKIDVEGFESKVIDGNDWSKYRPWIVLVEATVPMSQVENFEVWEESLLNAGYQFVYADGLNRFYLSNEHLELKSHFKYPPNVFDDYKTFGEVRAELRIKKLEKDVDELHRNLTYLDEIHNRVISSFSWRFTHPLRLIYSKVFKMKV